MSASREFKPIHPEEGDYIMWKRNDHKIYDAFPDGSEVDPNDIGLDFTEAVQVYQTKQAMCWRKLKSKSKAWIIQVYVCVRFHHMDSDGIWRKYCTTFSRDVDRWMFLWDEYVEFQAQGHQ